MLNADEIRHIQERLRDILAAHELSWIVRRVDDALDEGRQPEHGDFEDLERRRLVLLLEATQRALDMSSRLERTVPDLLLEETGGRRVHIEADPDEEIDTRLRPAVVIDREPTGLQRRNAARGRTQEQLARLLTEVVESR